MNRPRRQITGRPRFLIAACLAGILAASGYAAWFWNGYARPGLTHYRRGLDDIAARHYGEAKDEWQQGTQQDPTSPPCFVALGDFYAQAQHFAEAETCYRAASRLLPDDGAVFLKLAQAQQQQGNAPDAFTTAKRAAELRPDDAEAAELVGALGRTAHGVWTGKLALICSAFAIPAFFLLETPFQATPAFLYPISLFLLFSLVAIGALIRERCAQTPKIGTEGDGVLKPFGGVGSARPPCRPNAGKSRPDAF
ncbi:MAG: hypothetical protein M3Y13_03210 [Armatimonadota bacterium]|nr:hypothetical protein [Armatimonadota bacterium]